MLLQEISEMLCVSAESAVHNAVTQHKPLIVFLRKEGASGDSFVSKYFSGTPDESALSLVEKIRANYVTLSLTEGTSDFASFKQIFPALVVPSIVILKEGALLATLNAEDSVESFVSVVNRHIPSSTDVPVPVEDRFSTATSIRGSSLSPATSETSASHQIQHELNTARHRQEVLNVRKLEQDRLNAVRHQLELDRKERESTRKASEQLRATNKAERVRRPSKSYDECILSIKLFDGSTLRNEFRSQDSLEVVRKWIDEQEEVVTQDEFMPSFAKSTVPQIINYTFFAPSSPGRTFTVEQEKDSLSSLGLCPRSALFLKPVYGHPDSPAKAPAGPGVFAAVKKSVSVLGHAIYSFFDYGVEDARNNTKNGEHELDDAEKSVFDDHPDTHTAPSAPTPFMTIESHPSSSSLYNLRRQNSNTSTSVKSKEYTTKADQPRPHKLHRLHSLDDKSEDDESNSQGKQ